MNLEQDVDYLQQYSFVTCIHMNERDKRKIWYTTQLRHLTKPAVPKRVHFLPLQIGALSTKDRSVSPVDCTAWKIVNMVKCQVDSTFSPLPFTARNTHRFGSVRSLGAFLAVASATASSTKCSSSAALPSSSAGTTFRSTVCIKGNISILQKA